MEFSCPFGTAEKLLREKEYPSEPDNQGMEQATSQSMERAESRQPDRNLPFR